jgi:small-conductance mechanosensitive channel
MAVTTGFVDLHHFLIMRTRQGLIVACLLVLVAAAITGLLLTRENGSSVVSIHKGPAPGEQTSLVDQRPLQTARRLAALASTPEEQQISQETLRLADHEVDLAFADALRDAREHPVQLTTEARELAKHLTAVQLTVKSDQDRVAVLTKALAAAKESNKDQLQQQLDLSQAQLAMDSDELDDAKEDLVRAGGDPESKIQRLLDEHENSQHASDNARPSSAAPGVNANSGNLAGQLRAWYVLREKLNNLAQARNDTLSAASALSAKHEAFEQHVKQEAGERQAVAQNAADIQGAGQQGAKAKTAAAITSLHHFSDDQKSLSDLDKRIEDEQGLAENYASWIAVVQAQRRSAMHGASQSLLWILLIVLVAYLAGSFIEHYFEDAKREKSRLRTLRMVVRFAVQAVGLLLILFVIFGAPSQTPTILGLAGAGLTVALKDFIVAFFGWFVLMGRNGIRIGDWVEINGVAGEVVEIGLLRTVLLETGNWTDAGHPTGRRVAFVNSYAVEGHYFNFSTSGQWLWDEIRIMVPSSENPYPVIDRIQKLVAAETQADARQAELEWQNATSRYRVKSFSADPAINVRPTTSGVEVLIRYITRAHERFAVRARLYQKIVDALHQKHAETATGEHQSVAPAGST